MARGTLEADGSTPWVRLKFGETHTVVAGTFGSGTMSLEQRLQGTAYAVLDGGVAIAHTVADDSFVQLSEGDEVRWTLSGATNPKIDWSIGGENVEID